MSLNVLDIYNAFRDYFISFDLRSLAFKFNHDGYWKNLVSSLFFSENTLEDIHADQKSLSLPGMKNIRLFCFSDVSTKFEDYSNGLNTGGIFRLKDTFSEKEVAIEMGRFNPQFLQIVEHPPYLSPYTDCKLLGAASEHQLLHRHRGWELMNEIEDSIIMMGFDNINQWINEILKIERYAKGNQNSFFIGLPIKGKITELKIEQNEVMFNVKAHKKLHNLQINVFQQQLNGRGFYGTYDRRHIPLTSPKEINDHVIYSARVVFPKIPPKDNIEAQLINTNLSRIKIDINRCRPPLENTLEPLIKAFDKFYPLDQYKNQLINPEKINRKRKKRGSDWFFEEAVNWLLSMGGLSTIILDEKETYRLESEVELSADILAYKENEYLFVIDCDIQHADTRKANHLLQITEQLKFIKDESSKPEIIPVIFTPKEPILPDIHRRVRVITGPQIERLFKLAIEGDTKGFVTFLRH